MVRKVLPLLGVTTLAILQLFTTGCGGSSGGGSATIGVSVQASATKVDGTGTNSVTVTATVTNDPSKAGVSWTASGGTLSANSSASGAAVTFTPPAAASSSQSITIKAISAADTSKSGSVTISVPAALSVTNSAASLNGTVGATYSVQLQGSGGIPPYKNWAVASGNFPSCLTLNSNTGVITFTSNAVEAACAAGSPYDPVFSFEDSGTPTPLTGTTPDYTITITAASPLTLPTPGASVPGAGTAGTPYSGSVQAHGGAGTLTYTRTSGALPTGLTLDSSSGAITGTADTAGTYNFTVQVSDVYGDTPVTQSYSLVINPAPAARFALAAPTSLNAGSSFTMTVTALDAYNNTVTSYAGTVNFTSSDLNAILPASHTFTPADNGIFNGNVTLKTAGSQTVTATDGSGITGSATVAVSAHVSVSVQASAARVDGVGTDSVTLTATVTNDPSNLGVTWSTSAGTLSNQTATTATLTPPAATSSSQSITVTAKSVTENTASGDVTITVPAALSVTNSPTSLNGTVGTTYSAQLQGGGGIPPYNWTVASGYSLPACLTLNPVSGVITFASNSLEAACAAGSPYSVAFTLTDSGTPMPLTDTTSVFAITIAAAPALTLPTPSASVPGPGTAGTAYSASVQGSGGAGTLTYTRTSGALPTGLTLDHSSGAITGTANKAGTYNFTVQLSDGYGDTPATQSYSLVINPAPVAQFSVSGAPTSLTAGSPYIMAVAAKDIYNNTVTSYTGTVNFTSSDPNAVLPASHTFTPADGGIFDGNVTLETAGSQTVTATDGNGITGSETIGVNAAVLSRFGVTASTSTPTAGAPFSVTVTAQDHLGNTITGYTGTVHFTSSDTNSNVVLPADYTFTAAAPGDDYGTHTFTGVTLAKVNTNGQWIKATDSIASIQGLVTVAVQPAAPSQMVFTTQPGGGTAGAAWATQPIVTIEDQYGNTVTSSTTSISLAIGTNPGSGSLSCTPNPVNAVAGVATFAGCQINKVGAGYTLTASGGGFNATSNPTGFAITPAAASQLAFMHQPSDTLAGNAITPAVTVQVEDQYGNPTTDTPSVTIAIGTNPGGGTLSGTLTKAAVSGVATFSDLSINKTGTGYTLSASGIGSGAVSSTAFNITPAAAAQLVFTTQPGGGASGAVWSQQPVVTVEDGSGNTVTTSTASITLSYNNSAITCGTNPLGATAGVASFSGCSMATPGTNLILTASGGGLTGTSSTFTVTGSQLSLPDNPDLPPEVVNVPYSASIYPTGGVPNGPSYYFYLCQSTPCDSTNGAALNARYGVSIPNGNGLDLILGGQNSWIIVEGTPTAAVPVTFTITVEDSLGATATQTYTISPEVTEPVSGNIFLNSFCGNQNDLDLSIFTLTLSDGTNPPYTTTTNSGGSFSFPNVPSGTYTLTPSITPVDGVTPPESQFYPASLSNIAVSNNSVFGQNFNVSLGYTVSGTVHNSTGLSGPVYLQLMNNSCGNPNGTTILTSGDFSIRGVEPGNYNLNAWLDTIGYGQSNASDPSASQGNLAVSTGSNIAPPAVTGLQVTLGTPGTVSLTGITPSLGHISGLDSVVVINFNTISNNGVELPSSYTLQWSQSSAVDSTTGAFTGGVAGSKTFAATGANGNGVWFLNPANVSGLNSGGPYYFQVQGVAGSSMSNWSSPVGPVTLSTPAAAYTVTGDVTWTGSATGPLYVGFYDESTGQVWGQVFSNPTSPASYSIQVPNGNFGLFALVDNNNDGIINAGDFTNVNTGNGPPAVTISGGGSQPTIALPSASSSVTVGTSYYQWAHLNGGQSLNYALNFKIREGIQLPVAVTLTGGPNLVNPIDLEYCGSNCGNPEFDYSFQLNSGITPNIGDTYNFHVTYSGGSSEDIPAAITGWNNTSTLVGAGSVASLLSPSDNGFSDTPSFDWNYQTTGADNLTYQFWVCCGANGNIWQIPSNNSHSNGFTSSQIPQQSPMLEWGVDPTNSGNAPSPSDLWAGSTYTWAVNAFDSFGNEAQAWQDFGTTESGPLTLPAPNPSTLPAAQVNVAYNGKIVVSGGYATYHWQVSGLSDNLNYFTTTTDGSGNNETLVINGTPNATTTAGNPISFQVTVTDSNGGSVGPITYTIAVENGSPLSLPSGGTTTTLVNYPVQLQLNASGGTGPYSFTVNNIPTDGTQTLIADNVYANNNGTGALNFSGTPLTVENNEIDVTVTDADSATASQTYHLNVISGPDGSNNSRLSGTYSCLTEGYKDSDNSRWAMLSSIAFNGDGTVAGGVWDMNDRDISSAMSGTIASSSGGANNATNLTSGYSVGYDNNGLLTLNANETSPIQWPLGGASAYAIALSPTGTTASEFRLVETDDALATPSGMHSSGYCYQDNTSAFASTTLTGTSGNGFAFGLRGENPGGAPTAFVGRFDTNAAGGVTGGYVDGENVSKGQDAGGWAGKNEGSSVGAALVGGGYGSIDSNGRFNIALTGGLGGTSTANFVGYIVDANRMFLLESDPAGGSSGSGLSAGDMRLQTSNTPTSGTGITGSAVLYGENWDWTTASGGSVSGFDTEVLQLGFSNGASSSVQATVNEAYQDANGTYKAGSDNGAYHQTVTFNLDSINAGRATVNVGNMLYAYFFDTNAAFYLVVGPNSLEKGLIENQTASTFTNAAVAGDYMAGQLSQLASAGGAVVGEVAETSDASNNVSGAMTQAGEGSFSYGNTFDATYSWDTANNGTTYGGLLVGGPANFSCVVITPTESACTSQSSSEPYIMIFQQ